MIAHRCLISTSYDCSLTMHLPFFVNKNKFRYFLFYFLIVINKNTLSIGALFDILRRDRCSLAVGAADEAAAIEAATEG